MRRSISSPVPGVEGGGLDEFPQLRSGESLEQVTAEHRRWIQAGLMLLAAALTMLAHGTDVGSTTLNPPLQVPARAQQTVTLAAGTAAAMLPGRFVPAVEQLSFSGTAMQTASEGASVYSEKCAVCHGPGGEGGIGPSLVEGSLSVEVSVEVVMNGRNAMPAFGASLGADEIEAVALYIESLGSSPATTTTTASTALPGPAGADEVPGTSVAGLETPEEPEEEEEPTGSRADLTPVIVYLGLVALVALGLLIDYYRIRRVTADSPRSEGPHSRQTANPRTARPPCPW